MRNRSPLLVHGRATIVLVAMLVCAAATSAHGQPEAGETGGGYASGELERAGEARSTTRGTVLDMERSDAAAPAAERPATPSRGLSQSAVRARFGAPASQRGPVGSPPITVWEYPGYSVYFENDRVLHAVVAGHPEPVANRDELSRP